MRLRLKPETIIDADCWSMYIEKPVKEFRFDKRRKFRFDFCWPKRKIAVECEGGIWTRGRHVRGTGYLKDLEKYNLAVIRGYRVLRYTPDQIASGKWREDFMALPGL